tara:strand:+ start:225 stop:410 length:186 start_codon:yes stop_codon:yes gene_type:complete
MIVVDIHKDIIDKRCKRKYRHTNWCRLGTLADEEQKVNPIARIDDVDGIIYFKNAVFREVV